MKPFLYTLLIAITLSSLSCSKDGESQNDPPMESSMHLIELHESAQHQILLYSYKPEFKAGFNEILIQVKSKQDGSVLFPEVFDFTPVMHMTSKMHSCPHSDLEEQGNEGLYYAYSIFQMPGNNTEYWELDLNYSIEGTPYNEKLRIEVGPESLNHRSVSAFQGSDGKKYVLSLLPFTPKVAINEISAILFEMEDMMTFNPVAGYSIGLDPRMPGMGNHSSPNNLDFAYNTTTKQYDGQLSLTMTGYWVLNLQLFNEQGSLLKGEEIQAGVDQSSLYFELEF